MKAPFLLLLFLASSAHAFDYRLEFDQSCSYSHASRSFPCERTSHPITKLQQRRGEWVGKSADGAVEIALRSIKDDPHILVLQTPVYFSGVSFIHLMKNTGRFYWTETAYSEVLKQDESTVRVGRFKLDIN